MKKFLAKSVFASLALATASAFAATNGDLVVVIQDTTSSTDSTFVEDVGQQFTSSGVNYSTSLGSDFTSWLAGQTAANLQFAVIGGISTGGDLSSNQATGTPKGLSSSTDATIFNPLSTGPYGTLISALGTGTDTVIAGGTSATAGSLLVLQSSTLLKIQGPTTTNVGISPLVGTLNLEYYTGKTVTGVGTVSLDSNGDFTVSSGAPVPEPETYALMFAGLLAVGAMVRRRSRI